MVEEIKLKVVNSLGLKWLVMHGESILLEYPLFALFSEKMAILMAELAVAFIGAEGAEAQETSFNQLFLYHRGNNIINISLTNHTN